MIASEPAEAALASTRFPNRVRLLCTPSKAHMLLGCMEQFRACRSTRIVRRRFHRSKKNCHMSRGLCNMGPKVFLRPRSLCVRSAGGQSGRVLRPLRRAALRASRSRSCFSSHARAFPPALWCWHLDQALPMEEIFEQANSLIALAGLICSASRSATTPSVRHLYTGAAHRRPCARSRHEDGKV
jgi:hypothetical protein